MFRCSDELLTLAICSKLTTTPERGAELGLSCTKSTGTNPDVSDWDRITFPRIQYKITYRIPSFQSGDRGDRQSSVVKYGKEGLAYLNWSSRHGGIRGDARAGCVINKQAWFCRCFCSERLKAFP